MTKIRIDAPWHKESFDRFLHQSLPDLLSSRIPLAGYQVDDTSSNTVSVTIAVATGQFSTQTTFRNVPVPDANGLFQVGETRLVSVPSASNEHVDTATIKCVGEHLLEHIDGRLGGAPDTIEWDEALLSSWVPLDQWLADYLRPDPARNWHVMPVDDTNWLSVRVHLRRLVVSEFNDVIAPGQRGLLCPVECPEGPNLGRVYSISTGATIRDGRLVREDDDPVSMLGLTASMIPLIEYDDSNRALMGANMMRQWLTPGQQEPALVQSGNEPDEPAFWCGRNLLTAFISWGGDTYEDGIVISETAAQKLGSHGLLSVGDKLSNRHGSKGVVSRILPDSDMPHLADGTPVELCHSFIGIHARLNPGELREALLGRVAAARGEPILAAPFNSPDDDALRGMLHAADIDPLGTEQLRLGVDGAHMARRSTVGPVYWGQPNHRSSDKLRVFVGKPRPQLLDESTWLSLLEANAMATIDDLYNVQNAEREDAGAILADVQNGAVPGCPDNTPLFDALRQRLAALEIVASSTEHGLQFGWAESLAAQEGGQQVILAEPQVHPWINSETLSRISLVSGLEDLFSAVATANERLLAFTASGSPEALGAAVHKQLQTAVARYASAVLRQFHLKPQSRVTFSGRGVMVPGTEFGHDQLGLPEELAWGLFGPLITSAVGAAAVSARDETATSALQQTMAANLVLMVRGPATLPTEILAFQPVLVRGHAIRVPLQALALINGDFDGDQVAVMLPITPEAQREAQQKLTIAAHLARESEFVLPLVTPRHEALWALADLSRHPQALQRANEQTGVRLSSPEGIVTQVSLGADLTRLLDSDGAVAVVDAIDRLNGVGFEHVRTTGASMSTFVADRNTPPAPEGNSFTAWDRYCLECEQRIAVNTDYDNPQMGVQLLAVRSGARGSPRQLRALAVTFGLIADASGALVPASTCVARGRSADEFWHCAAGARKGLAKLVTERQAAMTRQMSVGTGGGAVLARALSTNAPGVVFAYAAERGETDPLVDRETRLLVRSAGES
jgi:hypothetical protein